MTDTELTEYQLQQINDGDLEKLAIDLLTRQGEYRGIDPQGTRGPDGGKDGLILEDDRNIILHVSRRGDWESKLEDDLDKADGHDREYDTFIFVTNRVVPGTKTPDLPNEVKEEYGWELDLWDQQRLRRELDNHHQDLRERYLNIARDEDPADKAARLIEERLGLIRRDDPKLPVPIEEGGKAVLHVIPHDAVASESEFRVDELPNFRPPGDVYAYSTENTLDGRVVHSPGGHSQGEMTQQGTYGYVHIEGWCEVVNCLPFTDEEQKIASSKFEKEIGEAFDGARDVIQELGLSGPVEVSLSLLYVEEFYFARKRGGRAGRNGPKVIRQTHVEGRPYTVDSLDGSIGEAVKPALDRAWRAARWSDGSPNYSADGVWTFENPDAR